MDSLVIFLRPRIPSWIWIWYIQYATHRNNFTSPPKLAMSTAMQNLVPTSSYFTFGQNFLGTRTLLSEINRATKSRRLQRLFPQTANTTLAKLWRKYLPHTSNNTRCFLYSLITPFRLFTSFLSHEACSTNANSLFHAAFKNLHVKANGIFVFSLLHPPFISHNLARKHVTKTLANNKEPFLLNYHHLLNYYLNDT